MEYQRRVHGEPVGIVAEHLLRHASDGPCCSCHWPSASDWPWQASHIGQRQIPDVSPCCREKHGCRAGNYESRFELALFAPEPFASQAKISCWEFAAPR